jgi:hypothetical protein
MIIPDELPRVLANLESLEFLYVVTGSLASVAWGKPRATCDAAQP